MEAQELFQQLWHQYTALTPSALKIHNLFLDAGEKEIINDHIAIRTFDDPRVNISVLEKCFLEIGYVPKGEYEFKEKKLYAKHYEHPGDQNLPKVFISQLKVHEFSGALQDTVIQCINQIPSGELDDNLILKGRMWKTPNHITYENLRAESEYAAWMYVYGFCVNHFTVFTNYLEKFDSLESVNAFLKSNGFRLNVSGGEIKGSPAELLEQSSTLADMQALPFEEGIFEVPSCYYEFARRYKDKDGNLYHGFIAASADKIFESTDKR